MPLVISRLIASCGGKFPPKIEIDFSTLGFIRPSGVVFLSNLIKWLAAGGATVSLTGLNPCRDSHRFLDDSLFFEQHMGQKLAWHSSPRATTVPLREVTQAESHMWLRTSLVPWLAGRVSVPVPSLHQFQTCLSEIFNNIADHTVYDIGGIFVQHFPRENRVIISIADFGDGIPQSVRAVCPELTDVEAIQKAVEDGFTTKSTPRNRGAGLDYLLRVVVLQNGGCVTIYSQHGIVMFSRDNGAVKASPRTVDGFSPGTLFDIELRTDTIEVLDDEEEEFEW